MSTYQYTFCPHCNERITPLNGERSEFFYYSRYIGLKYEKCPKCHKIFSTNKKLYYQMNENEKKKIMCLLPLNIFSMIISLFVFITLPIYLVGGLIIGLLKIEINNSLIWILPLIIIGLISIILGLFGGIKEYKQIKSQTVNDFDIDDELKKLNI